MPRFSLGDGSIWPDPLSEHPMNEADCATAYAVLVTSPQSDRLIVGRLIKLRRLFKESKRGLK